MQSTGNLTKNLDATIRLHTLKDKALKAIHLIDKNYTLENTLETTKAEMAALAAQNKHLMEQLSRMTANGLTREEPDEAEDTGEAEEEHDTGEKDEKGGSQLGDDVGDQDGKDDETKNQKGDEHSECEPKEKKGRGRARGRSRGRGRAGGSASGRSSQVHTECYTN